jgi:hypothetical protein
MATITITVTVAGGKFVLDGVSQATYSATPGNTYKFDQSDGTNATHPLRLSTTSDGTHNSGSAYTDGVTTNGTPGSAGAYTQIEVTATTVQSLFYYCSSHSGMGGAFNIGSSGTVQYQDRAGFAVQNRTENPLPYAQALIDDPYGGVWSSGGTLNTARYRMIGGMGTQTAGYVVGGATPNKANVESYNGTAWTETTDVPTGTADNATMGTATAGASIGGAPYLNTMEIWNGSAWAEGGTLPTGKTRMTAAGTTTATLAVGGAPPPGTYANTSLEYDGSSWTAGGTLPAIRGNGGQSGTQTAGFVFGGYSPSSGSTLSLTYNGTAFAATPDSLNNAFGESGFSVSGTQSSSWISGGTYPPSTATEFYDGTSWSASGDMAQKRQSGGSLGTGTLGLYAGGSEPSLSPTTTGVTEEFGFSGLPPATPIANYSSAVVGDIFYNSTTGQFKAVSQGVGSWSSGGSLGSASAGRGGAGPKTAAIAFGGTGSPPTSAQAITELYNGTSWTETGDMNTGRFMMCPAQQGSQTAALAATGTTGPSDGVLNELWNGSSWSEVNDLNSTHAYAAGIGTSTAALAVGAGPSPRAINESWDGTNWTEVGDLNSGRYFEQASGTQAAGLVFGGDPGGPFTANTEAWDGSSWTEVADLNTARSTGGGFGSQTSAIMASGYTPSYVANTEFYDGTSWSEVNDVATARTRMGSNGPTGSSGMIVGGMEPSMSALVEEWEIPDFETKTVTTS